MITIEMIDAERVRVAGDGFRLTCSAELDTGLTPDSKYKTSIHVSVWKGGVNKSAYTSVLSRAANADDLRKAVNEAIDGWADKFERVKSEIEGVDQ